jgi:hypothetical protein
MFGGFSVALGVGLVIVWIAGLSAHATPWLTWLDGLAGLAAIVLGLTAARAARVGVAGWSLVAFGLFVLWIVGLSTHGALWLAWWTFAFACGFVILTASAASGTRHQLHQRTV